MHHTCPGLPTDVQWYIGNPKLCCFGRTGVVPKYPICYTLSPLSIPSHCTTGWNGRTGIVPKCPHCPFHPTVPWNGMDGLGSYQSVPFVHPVPTVHPIPLYQGWDGQTGIVPKCPIGVPTVHPIQSYFTMGRNRQIGIVPNCRIE